MQEENANNEILYKASNYVTNRMKEMTNEKDLDDIVQSQTLIHQTVEKSVTGLTNFNEFSQCKYDELFKRFEMHTKNIKEMKNDLDYIFKKIRLIKTKINKQYPNEFMLIKQKLPKSEEEE
nr:8268_t:CDS:2 [Entrophospora candida]CAG8475291.1 172_t:CDS:2 [Entrophospora candida]